MSSSKNTILWLIRERNNLLYRVKALEENQEEILNLLKRNNTSFKHIEETKINVKELFDNIYIKYKDNNSVDSYSLYQNNSLIRLSFITNFQGNKRNIDFGIDICNDNSMYIFINDESLDNYLCLNNVKDIKLIYNTIDLILNNYSIENIKSLGFK